MSFQSSPTEGGSHADDPAVPSEQPFGGVIAAGGSVVGTEDAAGVPVLDPGGEAWRDGGDGDHGTFPALGLLILAHLTEVLATFDGE